MSKILHQQYEERDSLTIGSDPIILIKEVQEKQSLINDLEKELQTKDIFQQSADIIKLVLMFSPTFLGVFDVSTDILYVIHQEFGDPSLKTLFIVFLGFSILLQFVIWTIFLAICDTDIFNYDTTKQMTLYIDLLTNGKRLKAYAKLTEAYMLTGFYFLYRFLIRTPQGILYAFAGQLKILPFYLTFLFADAGKLQYTINEDFISEYQMKQMQFQKIQSTKNINEQITKKNDVLKRSNSALQEWDKDQKKTLREFRQEIDLTITDSLTRALIMKNRVFKTDRILDNAIFKRFLVIGDLIQAVFESLPMLVIQFVNNSLTDAWGSYIPKISFTISFIMVFIHACSMIYKLSQGETFPLVRLLQLIRDKDAYSSSEWIFGLKDPQTFEIQNERELIIYAQAEQSFFQNVDRIVFNIQGDDDFIKKAICGKSRLFKYLRLLTSKLNQQNTISLDFNNNLALDYDSLAQLIHGFRVSNAKGFDLKLNNTNIFEKDQTLTLDSSSLLKHLGLDLQGLQLGSLNRIEVPKTLESLSFNVSESTQIEQVYGILWRGLAQLKDLKYLYLNFQKTQIDDLEELSGSLALLDLQELNLNFDSTKIQCLKGLGNAIGKQYNLQKLTLKLYEMKIASIETIVKGFQNLKRLEHLEMYLGKTKVDCIDKFSQAFQGMSHLQHLSLNFGQTNIQNLEEFGSGLSYLVNLTYLNLYFGSTKVLDMSHINLHNQSRLTELRISFPNTGIKNIDNLRISNLQQINTLQLNFQDTYIEDIGIISQDIASLYLLKNLDFNLKKTSVSNLSEIQETFSKLDKPFVKFSLNLNDTAVFSDCQNHYKQVDDFLSEYKSALVKS